MEAIDAAAIQAIKNTFASTAETPSSYDEVHTDGDASCVVAKFYGYEGRKDLETMYLVINGEVKAIRQSENHEYFRIKSVSHDPAAGKVTIHFYDSKTGANEELVLDA